MLKQRLIIFFLFCSSLSLQAQVSNLRQKLILVSSDTLRIDTLSIIPGTLILRNNNEVMAEDAYALDVVNAQVILKNNSTTKTGDTLQATYRVFSFHFSKAYNNKKLIKSTSGNDGFFTPYTYTPSLNGNNIFRLEGLQKNGSISRGITIGNAQDVFVNSSFNLQLSGKISENVELLAAITDENIPVQPDGNTQQLQEFDKVFIQLSKDNNRLIAGDFEMRRPKGYFMNFFKKGQGLSASTLQYFKKDTVNSPRIAVGAAFAVSKGKFARNTISPVEGNQGPYRLTGANNELYIIVLAGSERVYMDGELLVRGLENDYVVDYNTAELKFTTRRLITKDKRINVEFEYSEKSYSRTLVHAFSRFESRRTNAWLNAYNEQDSKNQPLQLTLDSADKVILANAGDSLQLAIIPSADSIAFNADRVLYAKRDTVVNSVLYSNVFVYSTNADSANWLLSFSYTGFGAGNYVEVISAVNGKVYQWVAPVNGIPQGLYEPVTLLVTPKKQQMISGGVETYLLRKLKIGGEGAVSNYNKNLYSSKNKNDDDGLAGKGWMEHELNFGNDTIQPLTLKTKLMVEYVQSTFTPLERFRPVEFERDWNLGSTTQKENENITSASVAISKRNLGLIGYELKRFDRGNTFNGIMNSVNGSLNVKNFLLDGGGSILNTKGTLIKTNFNRHHINITKKINQFTIGAGENYEYNAQKLSGSDSLLAFSYSFTELTSFISYGDSSGYNAKINFKNRKDNKPKNNIYELATTANEAGLSFDISKSTDQQLRSVNNYRQLEIKDSTLTSAKKENVFLNRIEYNSRFLQGAIVSNTFYEIGTAQELKKEFSYLEVQPGQGVYAWIDYNGNNIKELDEFEVAAFASEANYVRIFTPTNEYISTRSNQFSEVLALNPSAALKVKEGKQNFLGRFNNQFSLRLDKKTLGEDLLQSLNSFDQKINDTSLISINTNLRNTIYFNRTSSFYSIEFTWTQLQSKALLTNGFESRIQTNPSVTARWNINSNFLFTTTVEKGDKEMRSQFFASRNYQIESQSAEPKISYQPGSKFRISAGYKYSDKKNILGSIGEKTTLNKVSFESRYNSINTGSINARFNFILVEYNADQNNSIAYEMLEGLRKGNNATWGLSIQRNLGNAMQLSLNYDGRKSEGANTVHTGGMQFRAFF